MISPDKLGFLMSRKTALALPILAPVEPKPALDKAVVIV